MTENRLLTDEELNQVYDDWLQKPKEPKFLNWTTYLTQRQDEKTRQATLKEIEAFKVYHYAQDPYGQRKEDSYSIVISDKQWEKLKGED